MHRYKTLVTDYEGMQGHLDTQAAQGWRLFSVTADTWRKSVAAETGMEHSPFDELDTHGGIMTQEYSASYYLLVFQRDETFEEVGLGIAAEEALPASQMPRFEE